MYDPRIGRFLQEDPIEFEAGDVNLYRYVKNSPTNDTDPSGLVSGVNHHGYPLHLGGSAVQPVIELHSVAEHNAFHAFMRQQGFRYGNAGRAAWAALTPRQQQAMIIRGLRAAGVPNTVIRTNIARIIAGANAGNLTARRSGFPGGRVIFGIGAMAIAQILLDPSCASAAQPQAGTWRNLPPETRGRVEMTHLFVVIDRPRFWNIFPDHDQRPVSAGFHEEWMNLGEMTVSEARQLEGLEESYDSSNGLSPPPSGYYRSVEVWRVVRFNGQR